MTSNDIFTPKNADKFSCELCDFKCFKESDWERHILTRKHKKNDKMMTMDDNFTPKNAEVTNFFVCSCGKDYRYRQGLWKHKKYCFKPKDCENTFKEESQSDLKILTNLVLDVVKQNKELVNQNSELTNKIVDICKSLLETFGLGSVLFLIAVSLYYYPFTTIQIIYIAVLIIFAGLAIWINSKIEKK
jgi:hypothetical protein